MLRLIRSHRLQNVGVRQVHGSINVSGALEVSCNYFFYTVGYKLSGLTHGQVNNARGYRG